LLDKRVKRRLVIENDDKIYNIREVLDIGKGLGIPVVFDNLHNAVNSCSESKDDKYWVSKCSSTWREEDGVQKIHYSQQDSQKKPGAHSASIEVGEFLSFCNSLGRDDIDIMLEVKDKNLSAVKCILACTNSQK
jgi:UV DNA damage endonuclease